MLELYKTRYHMLDVTPTTAASHLISSITDVKFYDMTPDANELVL